MFLKSDSAQRQVLSETAVVLFINGILVVGSDIYAVLSVSLR